MCSGVEQLDRWAEGSHAGGVIERKGIGDIKWPVEKPVGQRGSGTMPHKVVQDSTSGRAHMGAAYAAEMSTPGDILESGG